MIKKRIFISIGTLIGIAFFSLSYEHLGRSLSIMIMTVIIILSIILAEKTF